MPNVSKEKLINTIKLLKFLLTIDDSYVIKSTIESIIESLEEEI